jgi:hypothetical protein
MAKIPLAPVGIAKHRDFSFKKYPGLQKRIKETIELHCHAKKKEPKDLSSFFLDLEKAIRWALFNQALELESHATLKKEIEKLWGAKTKQELVNRMPTTLRSWLYTKEISLYKAKTEHDLNRIIRLLNTRAEKELVGRGRSKDPIPILLAADIAHAMQKIGIKPVASRPTETATPSVFYQIVQECFRVAGLAYKDPYESMKAALTVRILTPPQI